MDLRVVEGKQIPSGCGWIRNDTVYYGNRKLVGGVQARKKRNGPVRFSTFFRSDRIAGRNLEWLASKNGIKE